MRWGCTALGTLPGVAGVVHRPASTLLPLASQPCARPLPARLPAWLQLAERRDEKRGCTRYLVKWQGYEADPDSENWVQKAAMSGVGIPAAAATWRAREIRVAVLGQRMEGRHRFCRRRCFADHVGCVPRASLPRLAQCKDRLKEWETRGRDAWQAASQRLLQEASAGDA
jgi:hypothetical protein